eukprot:Em0001g1230a
MSVSILGCSAFLELERCLEVTEGLSGAVPLPVTSPPGEEGSATNNVSDLDLFDSSGNDAAADSAEKQKRPLADAELPETKEAKLNTTDNGPQVDFVSEQLQLVVSDASELDERPQSHDVYASATSVLVPIEAPLAVHRDEAALDQAADQSAPTVRRPNYSLGHILRPLVSAKPEFSGDNFLRGCKWAPDGTCVLVCSNDNKLRLYNLPVELYSGVVKGLPDMDSALTVAEGDGVYDFCWFPQMASADPTTCCFATCCKDHPIHLWDAFYGHNRCTYVAYNHMDEVIAPYSLAFSLDGEKLYAGFTNTVKIFQTCRPGRSCENKPTFEVGGAAVAAVAGALALEGAGLMFAGGDIELVSACPSVPGTVTLEDAGPASTVVASS